MKIALLQLNPVVGNVEANADRIARAVKSAADQGADLCLSTELGLTGYPPRDLLLFSGFSQRCLDAADNLARDLKGFPPVIIGLPSINNSGEGKPLLNSAFVLREGRAEKVHDKNLLPSYDVFDETRYFEPGTQASVLDFKGLRIGVTICEDAWNDKSYWSRPTYSADPLEIFRENNVDCILNLSASPFVLGKQEARQTMLGSIARKYNAWMVYANQVGGNDDLIFDGRSCAFSPDGQLRARAKAFESDLLMVDMLGESRIEKDDFTPESEAWRAMVLGVRDYAGKCGFSSVILGLSGGIDSALTAAVAAEAMGPKNVLGVLMPSPHSSRGSVDDSLELARNLSIRTATLPISDLMQGFDDALGDQFAGREPDVTEENIQSRIRGNLLMAMSNKFGSLLLTTGNKSELAVGYCTIYGDMCGGLAVISDLPKMLVFSVCRWLNSARGREIIPVSVIEKPPSAELRPDQVDQDSLPPYEELDPILAGLVEERLSVDEVAARGHDRATVARIARLVKIAEFKRRQAAPGIKITDHAFGTGWRMPLASGG